MSSTYNLEPPPTAKVLLQTTSGDIELEIFAKQTPLTSRNFIQHCLDGYYDGTIFHRLVPGFVLQGGDPTGTGDGGESIYPDGPFADEFHSRLKFNRRGLLGMANTGRKDDNGSQFFITLGKTEELTGKNSMFGRVVGDTIYNVIKMGEVELMDTPGSERPLYATKITGTEILLNPYSDMVRRVFAGKPAAEPASLIERKKPKKKAGKALLSFGAIEGDENDEPVTKKIKFNTRLVVSDERDERHFEGSKPSTDRKDKSIRHKQTSLPSPQRHIPKVPAEPKLQLPLPDEEDVSADSSSPEPEQVKRVSSLLEKTNAQIAELKASMRRDVDPVKSESVRPKSLLEEMIPKNAMRGRKRKAGNMASDGRGLKMLNAFRAKLDQAPEERKHGVPEQGDIRSQSPSNDRTGLKTEDEEANLCDLHFIANCQSCNAWDQEARPDATADDPDDKSWMSHSLNFEKDRLGKDLNWRKQNEDGLVVIDPREKARNIKDEHRKRRAKNGSNMDRDRNRDRDSSGDRERGDRGYRERNKDRHAQHESRHRERDRV